MENEERRNRQRRVVNTGSAARRHSPVRRAADRNQFQSVWANHPDYPVADWQYEVANDDTRLGYSEWVANQIQALAAEREIPGTSHAAGYPN